MHAAAGMTGSIPTIGCTLLRASRQAGTGPPSPAPTSPLPSAAAAASTGIVIAYLTSQSGRLVMSRTSSSAALHNTEGMDAVLRLSLWAPCAQEGLSGTPRLRC